MLFLWSVNHCTNSPKLSFFPFGYFSVLLPCFGGEGFVIPSTIHLPHFLFFNLFACTEKQNISSLLSGCNNELTECCYYGWIQTTNQTILEGEEEAGHRNTVTDENQLNYSRCSSLFCRRSAKWFRLLKPTDWSRVPVCLPCIPITFACICVFFSKNPSKYQVIFENPKWSFNNSNCCFVKHKKIVFYF